MTNDVSMHLREELPPDIVKGANLEKTMNDLFNNFEVGEQRNADLVNRFFDQTYFRGEESLINKLLEVKNDLKFDDIKDEGINLASLKYNDGLYDFKLCLDKVDNDIIKKEFIEQIHKKVRTKLGGTPGGAAPAAPYDDFDTKCSTPGDTNVVGYFQKVVNYLEGKENGSGTHGKKTVEILKDIRITNDELNSALLSLTPPSPGDKIPTGVVLTDTTVPANTKANFDTLLSFEIGKEADRTIQIANDFSKTLQGLFTNTIPAINTVVGESDEYRYDERNLGFVYQRELKAINDNTALSEEEKDKQINELKRKYYIRYLKIKNSKIGNALEELYNNDFDYSKVDSAVLKDYFDTVADIRLKKLFDRGMNEFIKLNFGNVDEFKKFYKELTDTNPDHPILEITLPDVNVPGATPPATRERHLKIHRKPTEGKNERLKDDIEHFGKNAEKSFDAFPMEFTINKSDINDLDITIEDKTKLLKLLSKYDQGDKYEIKGDNIGTLIYLFFIINSRIPLTTMNPEKQKEVEELFGKAKNSEHKSGKNSKKSEETESNKEDSPEKFKEEIEKLGPGKFENGSEIWIPAGASELPGGGYQWMKIKISNVDVSKGTFTGTIFGGELQFSKYEGKSKKFKMDKDTLDQFKKTSSNVSGSSDKVYLQPNPNNSDFNSFMDSLGGKLGTGVLSFPISGVTWDGNKFIQKITDDEGKEKEVEVKYFGASSDDKSTYKIEYNPIRRNFTVSSSFNGDEKGKDGKTEKKRFSYKRDMDWNNFLIFFTQKGLTPQTEEESNNAIARQNHEFKMVNGGHWKLNWFSINNIKNVFKTIKGNIKKKMDDYNKAQDEKLEDILIEDRGIYNKLAGVLGFIPSMKTGLGELQQEHYNNRNNAAWKEIEGYLKIYQSDPDFATTFDKVPDFAKNILGGKSYQQFLLCLNDNNNRNKNDIRKAAALLLANIEKGKSPYRGLVGWENRGYWVKVLLGEGHYRQFLNDKQRCLDKIKSAGKDRVQYQDILASGEMDYIINNVRGNPDPEFFGSHEAPGDDKNPDNPSKRLLSPQFADKLESLKKDWFTASSVEDEFNNMKHNDFNLAKKTFEKNIKSTRYKAAGGALKKMFTLACNDDQVLMYKRCFLIYLLSGALDVNCRKDLGKQAYLWGKSLGFPPALLAKNKGHPEQVVAMLDHFSRKNPSNKFSNKVKSYFHKSSELQGCPYIENLINDFDSRRNSNNNANEFCNYLKGEFLITKDFKTGDLGMDTVLKDLQGKANDQSNESGDNSLFCNATCINDAGILASPDTVRNRMMTTSEGGFGGETGDERDDRAKFFDKCAKEIKAMPVEQEYTNLLMNKFLGWFGLTSTETKNEIYKRISTASHYKKEIEEHGGTYHPAEKCKIKIKGEDAERIMNVPLGTITKEDVKKILWYGLEGRAWKQQKHCQQIPEALRNCFDAFQNYFQEAFDKGFLTSPSVKNDVFNIKIFEREQHYRLGGWDIYRKIKKKENDPLTVVGEDSISGSDFSKLGDKEKKNLWRPILGRENYLNDDMNEMEKQFKRNGCNVPTLTGDINEYEDLQFEYLNAA